jgi:long-chain acyl-CoA synthetase
MSAAAAVATPLADAKVPDTYRQKNVVTLFWEQVASQPNAVAARIKKGGVYQTVSWDEMGRAAKLNAHGLMALGIQPEDRVSILAGTRLEWVTADLGVLGAGAITVPIYQSNPAPDCAYIVNHAEAVAIFVEDAKQLAKIRDVQAQLKTLRHVIVMEGPKEALDGLQVLTLDELQSQGAAYAEQNPGHYDKRTATLRPDSTLTIIYTSGTTGAPKGAMITHSNMVYESDTMNATNLVVREDEQLFFLPLAHIFAKVIEVGWFRIGHVMAFAESIDKLVQNMSEVRPTLIASVPRVFEKVYAKVVAGGLEAGGIKAKLFRWALSLSEQVGALEQKGKQPQGTLALQWALAQKLVFKKVQGKLKGVLGGRINHFVSGGAPLSPKIGFFFKHAGVTILEGFGMTETSAGSTVNRAWLNKIGTVGCAMPGTEVRIASDGEILIKGPGVMKGYYKNDAATAETIVDGWLHTGDIGELDGDGYLKITDRKKDLIITAGGKNVAPQNIENSLKTTPLISQIVVLGDQQKYLAALITLNADNAKAFATEHRLGTTEIAELAKHPKVRETIQQAIDAFNAGQASYQTLKKFEILPNDFSQETGELTPTLKVKRKLVSEKYKAIVNQLFA